MFLLRNILNSEWNLLNSELRPNAGCKRELSGLGNYPRAIAIGANCTGVIVCGEIILGEHSAMGNCSRGICLGGYCLGEIYFPSCFSKWYFYNI